MYRRVVAVSAVLVALMLTAFAPAPFPRREARGDSLTLKDLIGDYRAVSLVQTGTAQGNGPPSSSGVTHVSITSTQWIFNKNSGPTTYDLRVDHAKKPVEMNFLYVGQKEPYGRAIVRREGNKVRVIYNWGTQRPSGFENQPGGYWDLTLVRE
jgi:uncharacterized protein (TIGR03067 family)